MIWLLIWIGLVVAVIVFPTDKKAKMTPGQTLMMLAALAIGGGLFGVVTSLNRTKLYQTYQERGAAVSAAVSKLTVERRGSGRNSTTHRLVDLRYYTPQRAAVDLRHETSSEVFGELKVGALVPVLYLPETPRTVVLRREIDLWRDSGRRDALLPATLAMFLGFALLAGLLKLRQHSRQAPS